MSVTQGLLINWQKSYGLLLVTSDTFHATIGILTNICNGVRETEESSVLLLVLGLQDSLGSHLRQDRLQEMSDHHQSLRQSLRLLPPASQDAR